MKITSVGQLGQKNGHSFVSHMITGIHDTTRSTINTDEVEGVLSVNVEAIHLKYKNTAEQ